MKVFAVPALVLALVGACGGPSDRTDPIAAVDASPCDARDAAAPDAAIDAPVDAPPDAPTPTDAAADAVANPSDAVPTQPGESQ